VADLYLLILSLSLLGYAVLGKGFAYIGIHNIYIGEILLALGIYTLVYIWIKRRLRIKLSLFKMPITYLVLALVVWGGIRTIPYLPQYGLHALRDAVIWGYSFFSIIVAVIIIDKPTRMKVLIKYYAIYTTVYITIVPISIIIARVFGNQLPKIPGTDIPIIYLKPGDVLVQLSGVTAFVLVGLNSPSVSRLLMIALVFVFVAFENRAGMLSYLVSAFIVLMLKPLGRGPWRLIGMAVLALGILWSTGIEIDMGRRQLSFNQIIQNVESIFTATTDAKLESTKEWRLEWWRHIVEYTIHGKYLWYGKGFGINLADDDGFQVFRDHSLRSPHNAHLNILARTGVPGLLLWSMVQISWAIYMFIYYVMSRMSGRTQWSRIFLFLLACWSAYIVNASFDVFLEGPVGGIWFWVIYGTGMAAIIIYKNQPEIINNKEVVK